MKIAMFYHSLLSDWNHGNAHFLRGIVWELKQRGHDVRVFEPADGWSYANLIREHGAAPLEDFCRAYPGLSSCRYRLADLSLNEILSGIDLALVHEWNDPELVRRIGAHHRATGNYRLLFHDTHHRSVTEPAKIGAYDLSGYDGVLAYGQAIADVYLKHNWARRIWVWHEAADTRVFRPMPEIDKDLDLVWIGNWGDGERADELSEFLLRPVQALGLKAAVYGVRYPGAARAALARAGIDYRAWLANFRAPEVFARARATVHVPRRPYSDALPGIPTIRPFEALACAVPLVCAPWRDSENLFTPGRDYLTAEDGDEMIACLGALRDEPERAAALARHGRQTILARHTCAHRADELLAIDHELASGNTTGNSFSFMGDIA
jgi:spore maturation protein CgeB